MKTETGIEILLRAMDFLRRIETPMPARAFVDLDQTGVLHADALLRRVSMMMLEHLQSTGMLSADKLNHPDAQIYGLTTQGIEMHEQLLRQAGA